MPMISRDLPTLPEGFEWVYNPEPPSESIYIRDVKGDLILYTFTPSLADRYNIWGYHGKEGLRKIQERMGRFDEETGWEAVVNRANNPKENND